MRDSYTSVIFDMDGVLVDSEPLWRRVMIKGFSEAGVPFSDEDCRKTTGQRFTEVVASWVKHHQLVNVSPSQLENKIIDSLIQLIAIEGKPMTGVLNLLSFCKEKGLKVGLATSSSHRLMESVLNKLNVTDLFDVAISAEHMKYGKPHPDVFINCAQKLGVLPIECLVIEDSLNGVIAAKSAQMSVIAVPDQEHSGERGFAVADYVCDDMLEVLVILKTLFS